jgi:protocatechuate 3,4-dioxygenase beta subunit
LKLLFTLILLASAAWTQSTDAVVSGNVLDPTGANIPNAVITALNLNTGVKTSVDSNASGVYLFAALPPGEYRFSAASSIRSASRTFRYRAGTSWNWWKHSPGWF